VSPPGVRVKHAFSRIGKCIFLSYLDVLARLGTLSGLIVRIASLAVCVGRLDILYFEDVMYHLLRSGSGRAPAA
jgi:hypothetical protein